MGPSKQSLLKLLRHSHLGLLGAVGDFFEDVGNSIADAGEALVEGAVDVVETVGEAVSEVVSDVVEGVVDIASDIVEGVGDVVSDIVEGVADVASDLAEGIGSIVGDMIGGIVDIAGDLARGLGETITDMMEGVGDLLSDIVENVTELDFVGLVSDLVRDVGDLVKDIASDVAGMVSDIVGDVAKMFSDIGRDLAETVSDIVHSAADILLDVTRELAEMVAHIFVSAFSMIKELVLDLAGVIGRFGACLGGRLGYYYAKRAAFVSNVGKGKEIIPSSILTVLTPLFPTLDLSDIRFVDNATLPANWFSSKPSADGMTFGKIIFFREEFDPASRSSLKLLAHELVHCAQVVRFGGESNFGCEYGKGYASAGFDYRNNPLEKEAYDFADLHFP